MESWIYFSIIAQGIWAITSLIDKFVISKGYIKNPVVYIVLNGAMNVLLVFLLPFIGIEPLEFPDFLIALFAGIMLSAAVTVYYKAVHYEEISRIKIIFQMEPILVLLLSFMFLGEILTKNHALGFSFLFIAGVIVSYKNGKQTFKISKAFYYCLIAMIFAALYIIAAKHTLSVTSFWSAFMWLRVTSSTALFVLFSKSIRSQFMETFKNMKNNIKGLLVFKMIVDFSAFVFAYYALFKGPASLVVALELAAAPLFTFALALFITIYFPKIIKEKIDKKSILTKLLALVFIVIGIVFVSI